MWRAVAVLIASLFASGCAWAADDWQKVRDLKSGSEVRVYKKGSTKPVLGKITGATDRKLILMTKSEVTSIPKEEIEKVEYHPPTKVEPTQSSETAEDGSKSASYGMSWSRGGWETVYQK